MQSDFLQASPLKIFCVIEGLSLEVEPRTRGSDAKRAAYSTNVNGLSEVS